VADATCIRFAPATFGRGLPFLHLRDSKLPLLSLSHSGLWQGREKVSRFDEVFANDEIVTAAFGCLHIQGLLFAACTVCLK
jgi:hypothetical protein